MRLNPQLEAALLRVKRLRDGGADEATLIEELKKEIVINVEEETTRRAKELVDRGTKLRSTQPDGQLLLPGIVKPYDSEPYRLIRDGNGKIIEQKKATPQYKAAEAERASKHSEESAYQARVKNLESTLFHAWAVQQISKGRKKRELRWGNFILETGIWRP